MVEIDINTITIKLRYKFEKDELTEADILEFFTIFETDTLFEYKRTSDWWAGEMNDFISEEIKNSFFLPFMNQVLRNSSKFHWTFMNELNRRLSINQDSCAGIKIMEIYTYSISSDEFKILCKDSKEEYFNLYLKILKKLNWNYKVNYDERKYNSDYWPFGFIEKNGRVFSSFVAKKLSAFILEDNFNGVLSLSNEKLLQCLNLVDYAHIILNSKLDYINFIITNVAKREDKDELYEFSFDEPDDSKRISQITSKKLIKILKELDDKKTDAIIGLVFHSNIHFRDFIELPPDVKKHFFITAHENNRHYHGGERQNLDWQLGQIKELESGYILQYIVDIIKEGELKKIKSLFWNRWLSLLISDDFLTLWIDPECYMMMMLFFDDLRFLKFRPLSDFF